MEIFSVSEESELLQNIKKLAKGNSIKRTDDNYLKRFLIGHEYDVPSAFTALQNYQSFIDRRRDTWLKVDRKKLKTILESQVIDVLENNGRLDQIVVWIRIEKWDTHKFSADEILEHKIQISALALKFNVRQQQHYRLGLGNYSTLLNQSRVFINPVRAFQQSGRCLFIYTLYCESSVSDMSSDANSNIEKELTEEEMNQRIKELQRLVEDNETLKGLQTDEEYLKRFLYSTLFNVEEAYERMKNFYELLLEFPEWFTTRAPTKHKRVIDENIRHIIPGEDKEGRPIYVVKFENCDPGKMELSDCIAVDDMMLEILFQNQNIKNGLSVIMDVSSLPLKLLKWLTPHNVKVGLKKLEATPIVNYRFHVVKSSLIVNAAIKMIWPFLSDKIKDMVKFHYNDLDSLHSYIDPDKLPQEYGGYIKVDVEKLIQPVYDKDNEILESFQKRREVYLKK
ncbi:unnamed protein product [Brassicogethes aeneus]|uniref:CRAL-TRIO domain-containing protein n=1 Tax=Brassicogethes aeneus TaxID=1431903 RepID=A0A9P0B8P7_BRAAE|nr:unnamed protein product [Brassicogethes aeneus]